MNIGRISSAVGLKGEVRVMLYSNDSENLKEGKNLLLKRAKDSMETVCKSVRMQNGKIIAKLEDINDRNEAEFAKAMEIFIRETDMEELPEGEHYVRDIIGFDVYDRTSGTVIGTLKDVIQNTAQSVLDIEGTNGKQILIPAVDAFMRGIDEEKEAIEVELIPGFID